LQRRNGKCPCEGKVAAIAKNAVSKKLEQLRGYGEEDDR